MGTTGSLLARCWAYLGAQAVPALRQHERDRALQRTVVCGLVAAIWSVEAWLGRFNEPHDLVMLGFTIAYAIASLIYRQHGNPQTPAGTTWIYAYLLIDPVYLIVALTLDPKTLGFLHPFVLIVIIRSGIRYGIRTMYLAWSVTVLATPLLFASSFWRTEIELSLSFGLVLLCVPLFFSSLIRRVHNVRLIEEERARVGAMKEAMVARSSFLSRVSHELRSPLQGIVSALDILELRQSRAGDDDVIERIRRSSLLLNTHLRDLQTLARGEAGRLEMRPEAFEARALVENVASAADPLAVAKGLRLRIEVPPEDIVVVADGARIDQVLTNLVINSIRYTETGAVQLSLGSYDPMRRKLQFIVSDTGPGLPAHALPNLLAPDRTHTGMERRGEGSGIGLAIVRTLVDHLGGTIEVMSQIGHGTTFRLEIPAEPIAIDEIPVVPIA